MNNNISYNKNKKCDKHNFEIDGCYKRCVNCKMMILLGHEFEPVDGICVKRCRRCGTEQSTHEFVLIDGVCKKACKLCGTELPVKHEFKQIESQCIRQCKHCGTEEKINHEFVLIKGTGKEVCKRCNKENIRYKADPEQCRHVYEDIYEPIEDIHFWRCKLCWYEDPSHPGPVKGYG